MNFVKKSRSRQHQGQLKVPTLKPTTTVRPREKVRKVGPSLTRTPSGRCEAERGMTFSLSYKMWKKDNSVQFECSFRIENRFLLWTPFCDSLVLNLINLCESLIVNNYWLNTSPLRARGWIGASCERSPTGLAPGVWLSELIKHSPSCGTVGVYSSEETRCQVRRRSIRTYVVCFVASGSPLPRFLHGPSNRKARFRSEGKDLLKFKTVPIEG
jgi:hypothetical protein